jgi:LPXTG-motif cell wall-anchored protein
MTLTNGTPLVLTGLIYGTYSVKETNTVGFTATVSAPATLDVSNKEGAVTVTNVLDALIFPSPVLGELTINKVLKDASGNKLTENLSFTVKVTGPSYPDGKTFTVSTAEPLVIKGLIYGTYTVEEQGADKYTSAVSAPVTFSATVTTGSITVTNTEKALGELTITKVLKDNTGTVLTENKTFNILVTGPSYPNGQTFTVSTTEPLVIKGLIYGNYTIVEQNAADYTVSYSGPLALSLPVSLTMNFLSAAITITNVQKTGTLGISKDVSKPSSVGGVAKTGETNQPYYLAGMGAMALAGAAILLLLRKRKSTGQ